MGSGIVIDEQIDINSAENDNDIFTDVRMNGETITRIVNMYTQRDSLSGEGQT